MTDFLHALGVGGLTALAIWIGYGVGKLAVWIVNWLERG